ncbi:uncharacterized protein Dmoj_GI22010 [Drosophila mojavensis]|uniref:MD-2-related lipid-recognition domain-containing protein n=1 Tax=Drosophila mojavensis TaxID=7230 RepID=B4KBA9_DROMO|nr:uncharacterized protein Dmoj_GI22010 [Drosophila mojavensis]
MRKVFMILVIVKLWLVLILITNNAALLKFTNVRCRAHNESWVKVNVCRLKAISRNKTVFNFNATMLYPAYQISLNAQLLKKANGYKPWLYNISADICRFIKKPYHPVVILFVKAIRNYTNLNHTCPYVGDLIASGLHVPYERLRIPFPTGEYLVKLDWFYHLRKQVSTDFYFSIDEGILNTKGSIIKS